VVAPAGRVGFLPGAWADVSTEIKRLKKDLDDWPAHCDRLQAAERDRCKALVNACDEECEARVKAAVDAMAKTRKPKLWPRLVTAGLAALAVAGSVWCAVEEEPGNWPCWTAGAAAAGAVGVTFAW
jgi:hypothetical protein